MARRALVVDDESDARDFVREVLEANDWQVDEASDGKSGLEKAAASSPDLVVFDVQMPEMNGFEAFGALVKDHADAVKDTRFVFLTGIGEKTGMSFSADEVKGFYGREPDAYVEKPMTAESFEATLKKVFPSA